MNNQSTEDRFTLCYIPGINIDPDFLREIKEVVTKYYGESESSEIDGKTVISIDPNSFQKEAIQ